MNVYSKFYYILLFFLVLPSVGQGGWEAPVQLDSAEGAYPTLSYSPDGELRVFYNNYQTNKMVVRKRAQGQTAFGSEVILHNSARAVGVHYPGGSTIDLAIANCDTATILKSTDNGDSFGWQKNYLAYNGGPGSYLPLFFTEDGADLRLIYGFMFHCVVFGDWEKIYYASRNSGTWEESGTLLTNSNHAIIRGAYESGNDVSVVTSTGVFYSSDNGTNYTLMGTNGFAPDLLRADDMAIGTSNRLYLLRTYTYGAETNDKHLAFTYSDDNGASWYSPQILITEGPDYMHDPIFTVDGNRMVVAWQHDKSGSGYIGCKAIKCIISEDGGQTWGSVETIFSVTGDELLHRYLDRAVWDIASSNGRVSLVYTVRDESLEDHVYIKDESFTNSVVVTMTSAASDPTRNSPIPVTVVFSEDVTGFTNTDITAGNGTVDDFTTVSVSNYTFNLTPTSQGLITADIPADVAQGASSNDNAAAEQFSRVYDSIGPTGIIALASGSPTNASIIGFSIVFNEAVSGFESNDVTLLTSGTATGAPPALSGAGSNYTVTINNVIGNGWLGIQVGGGVCTDVLGNTNSALAAVSNQIDTVRPTCAIARVGTSPTNAEVVRFSISFNESVGGFGLNGITLTNTGTASGQLSDLTVSGAAYTVDVSNVTGDGEVGIQVGPSNAWDAAGNGNQAGARINYVIDQTAPNVSVSSPSSALTTTNPVSYTITYVGADLVSLTVADINLNRTGTATGTVAITGSGTNTRTVTITSITGDGTLGITLSAGTARDIAGNSAGTVSSVTFTLDNTAPSISISSTSTMITGYLPIPVMVTFSEAVTGFTSSHLSIQNATVINFAAVNASEYTFDLVPGSIGVVQVDIPAGVATDAVGHGNTAASQFQRVYSLSPPGNVAASDGKYTDKIRITWTVDSDATQFIIYRHSSDHSVSASQLGTITGSWYEDLTASPGTLYYYWIKAVYPAETSVFSGADTGYRSLSAPGELSATDGTCRGKIQLIWSVATNAANYQIYRYQASAGAATAVSLGEIAATMYDDAAVVPGVVYSYWVTASNGVAGSQASTSDSGWCLNPCNTITDCDFDGDRLADPSVYEETSGTWRIKVSASDYYQVTLVNCFGSTNFSPASADYDGDGKADPTVYEETTGNWSVLLSQNNYARLDRNALLGGPGYAPISADYDGDRKADPAVYSPATGDWIVLLSAMDYFRLDLTEFLGVPGTLPVSADYDGDGLADPAVYYTSAGDWVLLLSGNNYGRLELLAFLGGAGYLPVPGDYDGDGRADPAVYNPSTSEWRILQSSYNYGLFSVRLEF